MATLTPQAKALLSTTIRRLRAQLCKELHEHAVGHYQLAAPLAKAGLDEERRRKRERLEAWLDERVRASGAKGAQATATRERLLEQAVKEAAATLLNRLVLLRHLEELGLSKPRVLAGGWSSQGYKELQDFAPGLTGDATNGYSTLLELVFDELSLDLPGLFGDVGLCRLFPVPAATLRSLVAELNDPQLASAWGDDTTLGWVYQYWNDPDREALDRKIADGGKIEPHEIASKTQMFTERYMVEWLLHNSLGLLWLCICQKNKWPAEALPVIDDLDKRRAAFRAQREAGQVPLDALMPISGQLEEHWKYFVPQPIPAEAVDKAPDSIRHIKLLDPACGSGHFLIIAFDLLAAMYREEARHRGEELSDKDIAEQIVENNLFGVDIDPRAVQIAAAGLYLKARSLAKGARPKRMNLVAPALSLGKLPKNDPAVVQLRGELKAEAGIPEELTDRLLTALAGVDHLGSLLKVDQLLKDTLGEHEASLRPGVNLRLGEEAGPTVREGESAQARVALLDTLEAFLARHSSAEDLGLRLDGEQLASGVRFVRMVKEGTYDVVVGNPPYLTTSKMQAPGTYASTYRDARADLFAGFYLRALELLRIGGRCGFVTLSNWLYLGTFRDFRLGLRQHSMRLLADLGKAAFTTGGTLISTAAAIVEKGCSGASISLRPHAPEEIVRDEGQPARTEAALLLQRGRHDFAVAGFDAIEGEPMLYWWDGAFLDRYAAAPKLGDISPARFGLTTGNNNRFVRLQTELSPGSVLLSRSPVQPADVHMSWVPFIMGSAGRVWFEPLSDVLAWAQHGLELQVFAETSPGAALRNSGYYFRLGIAFSMIGATFSARAHRFSSICSNKGSSVFPGSVHEVLGLLNSSTSRFVLQSLNPGIGFEVGDVNRLPVFPVQNAADIFATLDQAFTEHEAAREASVEFRRPGPSPWRYAQDWAQKAVDRPEGAPLLAYQPEHDPPSPASFVSFAFGVAMGRFGAGGEGILDKAPASALPHGICFLSAAAPHDSLDHPACALLKQAWHEHGAAVGEGDDLRTYLRKSFFAHHKEVYENRPIFWPLSSAKKTFVAWVSIHRFHDRFGEVGKEGEAGEWGASALETLLADHLYPERKRLEGELGDLRDARAAGDKASKSKAEKRFGEVQKWLEELGAFIEAVTQCAEKGPPKTVASETPREKDARYVMDLDDGVMVNSAALWPLLEPQWKDPKKWWKELATAQGRKDYDWAHLAARYFPGRVADKCQKDPSLAVAHKCFWRLFPDKAYAWELRLKEEIGPDFTLDEPGSDALRAAFEATQPARVKELVEAEMTRRARKAKKAGADDEASESLPLEGEGEEVAEEVEE